jgi:putative endonuclease
MTTNKNLGNFGEGLAKEYLLKNNYQFVAQNYKSSYKEIDLIFRLEKKLIFVEVKTRIKNSESLLEVPLTGAQTKNLKNALIGYCLKNKVNLDNVRLDLIIILINKATHQAELKHYLDIF